VIKHCTVLKNYHRDTPCLVADFTQMYQVFLNLIVNASYAMRKSETKTLAVSVHRDTDARSVIITVADTGCGIAPEHLDRIFEPFFTTHHSDCGTGLGLAVVKEIIESHGGTVQVQSRPGKGTTFTICLPVDTEPEGGMQ